MGRHAVRQDATINPLAWATASGNPNLNRPAGTQANPIVMKLLPLTHRVEGSVVDREGKPIAGVEIVADKLSATRPTARYSSALRCSPAGTLLSEPSRTRQAGLC